ncbi:MAG: hypothetical protein FWJ62_03525 [Thermaerobacter sp.]|nr:hypothetical protein [Bacillota bacterium]REJ38069.1 MAG: hypothetical protein DIU84_01905 [Bacillota bacterium]
MTAGDGFSAVIAEAARQGREWVLLDGDPPAGDRPFHRREMHVATGIVVAYGARPAAGGHLEFYTESYFVNRRTGLDLPCGSRRWNRGVFPSLDALMQAVQDARDDVPRRFPGLIRNAAGQAGP